MYTYKFPRSSQNDVVVACVRVCVCVSYCICMRIQLFLLFMIFYISMELGHSNMHTFTYIFRYEETKKKSNVCAVYHSDG